MAKAKKESKKKKGQGAEGGAEPAPSVVAHPRARTSIRRWRARAGMLGLVLVTVLSLRAGVPAFDSVLRGLAGGMAAHFIAWIGGIIAWRHLVLAELTAHREAQEARLRAYHEAAERRTAEALAAHAARP
jgi:hypothetical protein